MAIVTYHSEDMELKDLQASYVMACQDLAEAHKEIERLKKDNMHFQDVALQMTIQKDEATSEWMLTQTALDQQREWRERVEQERDALKMLLLECPMLVGRNRLIATDKRWIERVHEALRQDTGEEECLI